MKRKAPLIGVLALITLAAGVAIADSSTHQTLNKALAQTRVTLASAVTAALKHTPGRAVSSELVAEDGPPRYQVEILRQGTFTEITVDGRNGKILATRQDRQDRESHSNNEDD